MLKLNTDTVNTSLFTDVSSVYTTLQSYDTAYMNYMMCLESNPKYSLNAAGNPHYQRDPSRNYLYNADSCTPPDPTQLIAQIQHLQREIQTVSSTVTASPGTTPNPDVAQTYNTVLQLRKELDRKLSDLYQMKNSVPENKYQDVDSAIYATLLWATLATCLIYYITTL
jgi:hypothetical protein